jgi:hypothetical protein
MPKHVIRGSLNVEGRDLGEVVARVANDAYGDRLAGTLILVSPDGSGPFPLAEWVSGWLSPDKAGPAFEIQIRRWASGGLEFMEHLPTSARSRKLSSQ